MASRNSLIAVASLAFLASGCGGSVKNQGDAGSDVDEADPAADLDTDVPGDPAGEPTEDPAPDGVDDPVDDPVDEPLDDPVDEPVDDPADDPVDDPVDDPTPDPVPDPIPDPTTEEVAVVCGDGVRGTGEACDDGDTVTEDCDTTDVTACLHDCSLLMADCGNGSLDPGEACDDGDTDSFDSCTTSCTVNDNHIGAPCRCTGSGCSALDFTAGTITGCSALSGLEDRTRTLGCVRSSYDSTYGISIYGAEGYCTLMAIGCSGSYLCFLVPTTGDVSSFTCPSGYVVATETRVEMGMTITTKSCMVACTSDRECRWNAEELSGSPWYPGCGEWRCVPRGDGGAYICGDDRNYTP